MADETDLLLFTDFLVTIVVNTRLVLPKINAFKQYYVCKQELVYLTWKL